MRVALFRAALLVATISIVSSAVHPAFASLTTDGQDNENACPSGAATEGDTGVNAIEGGGLQYDDTIKIWNGSVLVTCSLTPAGQQSTVTYCNINSVCQTFDKESQQGINLSEVADDAVNAGTFRSSINAYEVAPQNVIGQVFSSSQQDKVDDGVSDGNYTYSNVLNSYLYQSTNGVNNSEQAADNAIASVSSSPVPTSIQVQGVVLSSEYFAAHAGDLNIEIKTDALPAETQDQTYVSPTEDIYNRSEIQQLEPPPPPAVAVTVSTQSGQSSSPSVVSPADTFQTPAATPPPSSGTDQAASFQDIAQRVAGTIGSYVSNAYQATQSFIGRYF